MRQAALKIVAIDSGAAQSSSELETPRVRNTFQDLLPDSSARRHFARLIASGVAVTSFIAYLVFRLPHSTPARNVSVGALLEVAFMLAPVYFFLLRPLRRYISERDAIARHLEERVCERTADLQRSLAALEETYRESRILAELTELLQASNMASEAEEMLQRFGQKLFPREYGAIYLYRSSRNILERAAWWGSDPTEVFNPDDCWALRRGRAHASESNGDQPLCRHLRGLPAGSASLCVPMMAQGNATGVLILNTRYLESTGAAISTQSRTIAPLAAGQIALALANLQLREKLRDQAIRDPLTSMFNRRYFEETADRELRRAEQSSQGAGMIMIDVDHFKRLNDTRGHEAGDVALRRLALVLQTNTRIEDIPCRYGGEEFLLLLSGVTAEDLVSRANQIREAVRKMDVQFHGEVLSGITISCGVAIFPDHGRTCRELTEAADRALYRAKREGRDRVVLAP